MQSKASGDISLIAAIISLVTAAILFASVLPVAPAQAATCQGATLNIVAHQDDDLLFLNPDILQDIAATGRCVRTLYITAGDAGGDESYWSSRESGVKAAYAKMAGKSNAWTKTDAGVAGHPIPVFTLKAQTTVSLAFMRLPDGTVDGSGFETNSDESLQKLWAGSIPTLHAVNGSSSYTKQSLISTLTALMNSYKPTQIRAQDYVGGFNDGDHSDHHAAAYFARAAHQQYALPHTFTGYQGYATSDRPQNVSGTNLSKKQSAFYTYAVFDEAVCTSSAACEGNIFSQWLMRQYTTGSEDGGATTLTNIAPLAAVRASSENVAGGQLATKAVDGSTVGWPGDHTKEWATVNGKAGSWLKLTWSSPRIVSRITLFDRPNSNDQVTAGKITFSDGTSITTGALANNGSAVTLNFAPKIVTSLQFNATTVSGTTSNVGLSEIQVFSP